MPDAVVVTAVIAPAHIRSMAKPGTDFGSPASSAAVRPMVRPWSPIWVVAATATSSTRSGGRPGLRRISSRMHLTTRSSARVSAYWPFALPNGVRTPSTKTTSRSCRGTRAPRKSGWETSCYWLVTTRWNRHGCGRRHPSCSAQRGVDGGDVLRRRAAAAADQVDAELVQGAGVLRQVAGGGVVLEVVADDLRQAGGGLRHQQEPVRSCLGQLGSDLLHLGGAATAVGADRVHAGVGQGGDGVRRSHAHH